MNKKSLFILFTVLFVGLLCWHFLIKDYNYRISFTTKDSPALIYTNLANWKLIQDLDEEQSQVTVVDNKLYKTVSHRVTINDSVFIYHWKIKKAADSLTRVTVYITDTNNQFKQNLSAPFTTNDFVKRSIKTVNDLGKAWVKDRENYRIGAITKDTVSEQFCAYISIKDAVVLDKAGTMMRNIADVMGYIKDNNLELKGDPFLQVTHWDEQEGIINYDFCFPIHEADSLVPSSRVKFKKVPAFKGIKTVFNGNYRISDKAWYSLLDYASENNVPVSNLPFEIYRNDPHEGGDPLQWDADILLPIKE